MPEVQKLKAILSELRCCGRRAFAKGVEILTAFGRMLKDTKWQEFMTSNGKGGTRRCAGRRPIRWKLTPHPHPSLATAPGPSTF